MTYELTHLLVYFNRKRGISHLTDVKFFITEHRVTDFYVCTHNVVIHSAMQEESSPFTNFVQETVQESNHSDEKGNRYDGNRDGSQSFDQTILPGR